MKFSQFNTVLKITNRFALYNSLEQKVIFLDEQLKDILEVALQEDILQLNTYHPDFYSYLYENNFLVTKDVNEIEKIQILSKEIDENHSDFLLTVNPTMNCNFKCWYCYETHIKDSRMESSVLESTKLFIEKQLASDKINNFYLSFFGGEPLLYFNKNVTPLVDTLKKYSIIHNKAFEVSFTTNGFLINDDFINYFIENDIKPSFQITLDGYKEEHNKVRFVNKQKGSYDKIIENITHLLMKGEFNVILRVNYTDINLINAFKIIDDLVGLSDEIKQNKLIIDFHRVWQNIQLDDLDILLTENIKIIESKGFKCHSTYSSNNVLNSCYADKRNSATINYNGDLFKCTARDFLPKNRSGYLNEEGDLIWDDGYIEQRMNSKFKNKPCLKCKILPLCNGGCSQHAMENKEEDYCIYHGDENEKNKVVIANINDILKSNNEI